MHITPAQLPDLAARLLAERKHQRLSRSQAAAVCNVSPSFIRDAESAPERWSRFYTLPWQINESCQRTYLLAFSLFYI